MLDYLLLLAGVACAAVGGELFVNGAVGIARWARVTPGIVAVTVAAFATSSPELSVAINAALDGAPQIALGNALGANVVNVALIFGLALLIAAIRAPRDAVRRDFPAALAVPLVTAVFVADGMLSRLEGALMAAGFAAWLVATVVEAGRQRRASNAVGTLAQHRRALLAAPVGLALLVVAGDLIVDGALGIAAAYGLDAFVIGATVVAIGTTVPELATTIMAKLRGHDEVGLGTVLGSNIFNGLLIVSVAAVIHPIVLEPREVHVALGFGVGAIALLYPAGNGVIGRGRGALLLALYLAWMGAVLLGA